MLQSYDPSQSFYDKSLAVAEYDANKAYSNFKFPSINSLKDISSIIQGSERQFLAYLVDMFTILNKDKIELDKFNNILDALIYLKREQESDYLGYLVRPEKSRGCKIPSQIPIPSSSFQLRQSTNLYTNASGNCAIAFNPYYLGTTSTLSTFFYNNDVSLTGSSASNFFAAYNIGQAIPNVYSQYRLVSASVVVKYTGRMDIVQGLIGGAIMFDSSATPTNIGAMNAALSRYGDYNIAQDAFFQQEHHLINGIREIYFPLDSTYEQYLPTGTAKTGFLFFVYILGGPPLSTLAKLDVFLNFECLPDATFLNYIPTSISPPLRQNKEDDIRRAQREPITKETAALAQSESKSEKSTFDKILDTVGLVIPGIADIARIVGKFV